MASAHFAGFSNILETLSNIQYADYGYLFAQMEPFGGTSARSLNVLGTLLRASTPVVGGLAFNSNSGVFGSSFELVTPGALEKYMPFIIDHQYRVLMVQQKNISTLASIASDQQRALDEYVKIQARHDVMLAKHEVALQSSN